MQIVVERPSRPLTGGREPTRSVLAAAILAVAGVLCVAVWSLASSSSDNGAVSVVGSGVVDSDPLVASLAVAGQQAKVEIGNSYGGSWVNDAGELQVSATSPDALAGAVSDGVVGHVVDFTSAELAGVVDTLNTDVLSPDSLLDSLSTGWAVDVVENRLVIETDDPGAVFSLLESLGVDDRMVRFVPGVDREMLQPGSPIHDAYADKFGWAGWSVGANPGIGCSMGVPVVGGFISAGHCAMNDGDLIGFVGIEDTVGRVESTILREMRDAAFIRLDAGRVVSPIIPGTASFGPIEILGVAEAPVGAEVCKVGLMTGRTCGKIVSRNHSILIGKHQVFGLIETDICASQGDSGGVLMWGNQVQGIVSSGGQDGGCKSQYQPINQLLERFGVDLMTPNGPVPRLANYEPVAKTADEALAAAGGAALPGSGGTANPAMVVTPDSSDVPVLPGVGAPVVPPVDNAVPVLPGSVTPIEPLAPQEFDGSAVAIPAGGGLPGNPVPVSPAGPVSDLNVNLLVNGGFESVILPDDTLLDVAQVGWVSSRAGNVIETWEGAYERVGAQEGRHLIELNGDGPDSISQTIASMPGSYYQLTFRHRGRVDIDRVKVTINGLDAGVSEAAPGVWSTFVTQFADTNSTITVQLTSLDEGTSVGNLIDDVQFVRIS